MAAGQYALSDEQELLRATCRRMAVERVAPRAAEIHARAEYPDDLFAILREAGLLGLPHSCPGVGYPASGKTRTEATGR